MNVFEKIKSMDIDQLSAYLTYNLIKADELPDNIVNLLCNDKCVCKSNPSCDNCVYSDCDFIKAWLRKDIACNDNYIINSNVTDGNGFEFKVGDKVRLEFKTYNVTCEITNIQNDRFFVQTVTNDTMVVNVHDIKNMIKV